MQALVVQVGFGVKDSSSHRPVVSDRRRARISMLPYPVRTRLCNVCQSGGGLRQAAYTIPQRHQPMQAIGWVAIKLHMPSASGAYKWRSCEIVDESVARARRSRQLRYGPKIRTMAKINSGKGLVHFKRYKIRWIEPHYAIQLGEQCAGYIS